MTGYGEASGRNERRAITVSLKTVNHRFLDVQLRLGDDLRASEVALRELLARELARGRVEARVEVRLLSERGAAVEIDVDLVKAIHAAVHELVNAGLLAGGLTAGDLLRMPSALRVAGAAEGWDDGDAELLLATA
jgi:uncharacterized protein (TIGR00255 family)